MIYDEADAYMIGRVRKKAADRQKRAFESVLCSEEGRVFLSCIMGSGYLYDKVDSPEAEGARRLVLALRTKAREYGLLPQWRKAEEEEEDFQDSIARALREEDEDGDGPFQN